MNKFEKFFDKVSSKSKPESNQTASKVIESSKEFLEKGNYVLDFGCGSGAITNKLSKVAKSIDAIDISSGMLEFAKKQAEKDSIANINYIQASIFDERFEDEKYDAILAFNVLHYIEDLPRLIERINTLLKPNGIFVSSTACLKEKRSLVGYLVLLLTKIGMMPKIFFYKKNELEALITNGNFEMLKSEKLSKLPEYFIVTGKRE
jgi:2-polyprenyl-3-methyl-5-hydroxy-6-metoxy-1,4-benzoquinol methylase